jgi:5-formyltetrahydrofolate cyclo-ligase
MCHPCPIDPKPVIRRRMRMVRESIDDALMRSVDLWGRLAALDEYRSATVVLAYAAQAGEPDTDGLHGRVALDGKQLLLPRLEGGGIVAALVGPGLTAGAFGILEPGGPAVDPATIDLVILPGLAFTVDGARLGQGGGHYDRFLAGLAAPTIGVCFAEQVLDVLPGEPHDVRVGRVLAA